MATDQLQQAIALIRAGRKAEAAAILQRIVEAEPQNQTAWLWYADAQTSPGDRIGVLQACLRSNPDFEPARRGLAMLRAGQPGSSAAIPIQPTPPAQTGRGTTPAIPPFQSTATPIQPTPPAQTGRNPWGDANRPAQAVRPPQPTAPTPAAPMPTATQAPTQGQAAPPLKKGVTGLYILLGVLAVGCLAVWGSGVLVWALRPGPPAQPGPKVAMAASATPAATTATPASTQSATPEGVTALASTPSAVAPTATSTPSVKIAILVPLSGNASALGASARNGALLAIKEWNARGGVLNRPVQAVIEDSQCQAATAQQATNKAIDAEGVHYIIGDVCSGASIPISEIAEARGVVQISPTSSNPQVTVNTDGSTKDYIFRACFIDPFQGTMMAKFALGKGYKTAFVMVNTGYDYSLNLADAFTTAFKAAGGRVVGQKAYSSDATNFSAAIAAAAASGAQALYLPDYYAVVNLVGRQAKQQGFRAVMLGGDGWDSTELDVKAADGGFYINHYDPTDTRDVVQQWVKNYRSAYQDAQGKPIQPDAVATLGYDATKLMLSAIQQAGVDDPAKVKDTLAGIRFEGVTGSLTFDAKHDPIKSAVVVGVANGQRTYVSSINP